MSPGLATEATTLAGPVIEPPQLSRARPGSTIWVWPTADRGFHGIPVTCSGSARAPSCSSGRQPGLPEESPPADTLLARGATSDDTFADQELPQRKREEARDCVSPWNLHRES